MADKKVVSILDYKKRRSEREEKEKLAAFRKEVVKDVIMHHIPVN